MIASFWKASSSQKISAASSNSPPMGKLWLSISHTVLQSSHVQLIGTHLFWAVGRKNWTPVKTLLVARIRLKIINVCHPYYKSAEHFQPLTKFSILSFRFNHPAITQKYSIAHRLKEKCVFSRIFASPEHARTSRTSYDLTLWPGAGGAFAMNFVTGCYEGRKRLITVSYTHLTLPTSVAV